MQKSFSDSCRPPQADVPRSQYADMLLYESDNGGRDHQYEQTNELQSTHCKYRGRLCYNLRDVKIDGSLHTMCYEHRRKANANQRRSAERKSNAEPRMCQASILAELMPTQWERDPQLAWSGDHLPQRNREENDSLMSDIDDVLTKVVLASESFDVEMCSLRA